MNVEQANRLIADHPSKDDRVSFIQAVSRTLQGSPAEVRQLLLDHLDGPLSRRPDYSLEVTRRTDEVMDIVRRYSGVEPQEDRDTLRRKALLEYFDKENI